MLEAVLGILVFTGIVMCLVLVVLTARSRLVALGEVDVVVNDDRRIRAPAGAKLLEALGDAGIHLPAACGARGTCGLCRVDVISGGGVVLPVEVDLLTRRGVAAGARLACQVALREEIAIRVPDEILGVKQLVCRVRSSRCVATFIKEIVLELPPGEELDFRAGAFVQLTCPPFQARFDELEIDAGFRDAWDRLDLWHHEVSTTRPTTRAYSLANHPGEKGIVMLNVRIATPPPDSPRSVPAGVVSTYLFRLQPGDEVTISGPFGHFFAADTKREMIFVGGGAGMAPMRSHVLDQLERLRTEREISFWYGARNLRELFYVEEFERLQAENPNFRWVVALSDPRPEDDWTGAVGFIHDVLYEQYLKDHPAPESCEYYLCGPPMMIRATRLMLEEQGVAAESIHFDDFGG